MPDLTVRVRIGQDVRPAPSLPLVPPLLPALRAVAALHALARIATCRIPSLNRICIYSVLRSRSRKEPHLLVGAGAGAITRCGSGSDNGIKLGWVLKIETKCNSL
jgi:hypothetical protein